MLAKVFSAANTGYEGRPVEVECDISSGLPGVTIVGLPNKAIDEAKERVRSAMKNSGLKFPPKRVTLNLAPANLPKDGTAYDTSMAVAILAASKQVGQDDLSKCLFVGELALEGAIRPISGVLSYVETARQHGFKDVFIPKLCVDEARLIEGVNIYPVSHIKDIYQHLNGEKPLKPLSSLHTYPRTADYDDLHDFGDIYGQQTAKRALEIAAAGAHNILLTGPPGSGKTMLAKSTVSILPPPTKEEVIAITKIHSLKGEHDYRIVTSRPFRNPHHTTSDIALIGGGQYALPGEISLAHHGILFLDELPEFKRHVLEVLRQPLEDGMVTVTRARHSSTYPADFMLIATQNPCPCGYLNDPKQECSCSLAAIDSYQKKISGPLLDRIDIVVAVQPVEHRKLLQKSSSEPSKAILKRVKKARNSQMKRQGKPNSTLSNREIKKYCQLNEESEAFLQTAMETLQLSARGYMRVLKTARTIADLDLSSNITTPHLSEALQYRESRANNSRS